jgi:predicted RNase H-like HicB family nuclease
MEQTMNYPVVIHKDQGSDYGVTVPDLPGCFSAGSTIDEAIAMAQEAIELHLEGLIEEGEPVPEPGSVEQHQRRREFKGGLWAIVTIASSSLRLEAKRVNITMPRRILDAVDRFARSRNDTRSGLLTKAATAFIRGESDAATPGEAKRRAGAGASRTGRRRAAGPAQRK